MALRKFRKNMKVFSLILTVVFILSLVYGGYMSMKTNRANKKAMEAFQVNSNIVYKLSIEREKNNIITTLNGPNGDKRLDLPQEEIAILATDKVLKDNLMRGIAKNLGVKVSSSEINEAYNNEEKYVGDKAQFKRMLNIRGYQNAEAFKEDLETKLLLPKLLDKLTENFTPEKDQVDMYYAMMSSINPSVTRDQAVTYLKNIEGRFQLEQLLNKAKQEMKIKDVAAEYQNLIEKEVFVENGIPVTNVDIANSKLDLIVNYGMTKEKAEEKAAAKVKEGLKIVKLAQDKGIMLSEKFNVTTAEEMYRRALIEKYKSEVKYSDADLKKYFEENKILFEKPESAGAHIMIIKLKPSEADQKLAETKAQEVLNSVTYENFKEKAEEYSKKNSYIYEELGKFTKGQMVKEFEEAVSKAAAGTIVPNVVKTVYGYHVIAVNENKDDVYNASHIMVPVIASDETYKAKLDQALKMADDLKAGTVSFDELAKKDKDIVVNTDIPVILRGQGLNISGGVDLEASILDSKLDEIKVLPLGKDSIAIFKKTAEQKFIPADFETAKKDVEKAYVNAQSLIKLMEDYK